MVSVSSYTPIERQKRDRHRQHAALAAARAVGEEQRRQHDGPGAGEDDEERRRRPACSSITIEWMPATVMGAPVAAVGQAARGWRRCCRRGAGVDRTARAGGGAVATAPNTPAANWAWKPTATKRMSSALERQQRPRQRQRRRHRHQHLGDAGRRRQHEDACWSTSRRARRARAAPRRRRRAPSPARRSPPPGGRRCRWRRAPGPLESTENAVSSSAPCSASPLPSQSCARRRRGRAGGTRGRPALRHLGPRRRRGAPPRRPRAHRRAQQQRRARRRAVAVALPRALRRRARRALNDYNFYWVYPYRFNPGHMRTGAVDRRRARRLGRGARPPASRARARSCTSRSIRRSPPGAAATVDVDFRSRCRSATGRSAACTARCTLTGFYPMVAPLGYGLDAMPGRGRTASASPCTTSPT